MTGVRAPGTIEQEVRACFDAYEDAMVANDVVAMNGWFYDDARTIRFGIADEEWGVAAVRRWRHSAARVPPGRLLSDTHVSVVAASVAVVTTLFRYPSSDRLGRQSQTWIRTDAGWRIMHAHVSERMEPA